MLTTRRMLRKDFTRTMDKTMQISWNSGAKLDELVCKQRRTDARIERETRVRQDMDIRDKWLGLKSFKADYKPLPYHNRTHSIRIYESSERDMQ